MSKLRANIFLIPNTSNYLWSSVVGIVKADYFDFPCEIFEILCELDVGYLPANFRFLENFRLFPIFSAQTRLFLNQK